LLFAPGFVTGNPEGAGLPVIRTNGYARIVIGKDERGLLVTNHPVEPGRIPWLPEYYSFFKESKMDRNFPGVKTDMESSPQSLFIPAGVIQPYSGCGVMCRA
jgi:hypothetical protein